MSICNMIIKYTRTFLLINKVYKNQYEWVFDVCFFTKSGDIRAKQQFGKFQKKSTLKDAIRC